MYFRCLDEIDRKAGCYRVWIRQGTAVHPKALPKILNYGVEQDCIYLL